MCINSNLTSRIGKFKMRNIPEYSLQDLDYIQYGNIVVIKISARVNKEPIKGKWFEIGYDLPMSVYTNRSLIFPICTDGMKEVLKVYVVNDLLYVREGVLGLTFDGVISYITK